MLINTPWWLREVILMQISLQLKPLFSDVDFKNAAHLLFGGTSVLWPKNNWTLLLLSRRPPLLTEGEPRFSERPFLESRSWGWQPIQWPIPTQGLAGLWQQSH